MPETDHVLTLSCACGAVRITYAALAHILGGPDRCWRCGDLYTVKDEGPRNDAEPSGSEERGAARSPDPTRQDSPAEPTVTTCPVCRHGNCAEQCCGDLNHHLYDR